jgi:hypothetical protein
MSARTLIALISIATKKPGLKPGFFNSVSPTSYFGGVILAT